MTIDALIALPSTGTVPRVSQPSLPISPTSPSPQYHHLTMAMTSISPDTLNIGTYVDVAGNQNNFYLNVPQNAIAGPSSPRSAGQCPCPSFNDAPLSLLSVDFTGREEEIALIIEYLETVFGDVPTHCAIHGMPGVGKSQLAYMLAKLLYDRGRYTNIFWMQATTVEKLHQGFSRLLQLVSHPHHASTDNDTRLTAARRWLEEFDSGRWLLVVDNVARETVHFLHEHLPRKNARGNILFTTRTEDIAEALTHVTGERHRFVELRNPDVEDAATMLLKQIRDREVAPDRSKIQDVVKGIGCLPLAISQAASYMMETGRSLEDMQALIKKEGKIHVGVTDFTAMVIVVR
jgi:hypothetical protein